MVEITRHFTTSVYIVYDNKVLLHIHKKLDMLLPPGGHILTNSNHDELPHEAATREVKEECGLDIDIQNFKKLDFFEGDNSFETVSNEIVGCKNEENRSVSHISYHSYEINTGEFCNVHFINPYHQHIDFIYIATSLNEIIKPGQGESKHWSWFTKEEIEQHTKIKAAVKKYALYALEKLKE